MRHLPLSDEDADRFLLYAFFAWCVSCVVPVLGLLIQIPAIIYLAIKCDMKSLPALLVLMFGRNNFALMGSEGQMAIRMGVTLTPTSCLTITAFFFTLSNLLKNRYDQGSMAFGYFWLLSSIPAFVISFKAKIYAVAGFWSGPIFDFFVPALYYWGMTMGRTYESGKIYLIKRIWIVLAFVVVTSLPRWFYCFTYYPGTLLLCITYFVLFDQRYKWRHLKMVLIAVSFIAIIQMLFGRRLALEAAVAEQQTGEVAEADKTGGTFTAMGIVLCALPFAWTFSKGILRNLYPLFPVLMVMVNVVLVSYVITTQSGNHAKEVSHAYETFIERFQWKLFGDRGAVWTQGWEDVKRPPVVFKDLRIYWAYKPDGSLGMRVLPHNQYLKLLSRDGLWLGGVLSIFIIWVWVRAFRVLAKDPRDRIISVVFMPTGAALFFIDGITGQSTCGADLWANALVAIVMPGIVYGQWRYKLKMRRMGCLV